MAVSWEKGLLALAMPILAQVPSPAGSAAAPPASTKASPQAALARRPLSFEENRGQAAAKVKFLARGAGHTLLLGEREAEFRLHPRALKGHAPLPPATLRLRYLGANPHPRLEAERPLPGKVNYLLGQDPARWRTGLPTSGRVRYRDLYPGTDLVFYGQDGELEYDFVLKAGADPSRIRLQVRGADRLDFTAGGDLRMQVPGGELLQRRPDLYQELDGRRVPVEGRFRLVARNTLGFEVKAYDHRRELVVDPGLVWGTYVGGYDGTDYPYSLKLDASGNILIAGRTDSGDFPTTAGAYQPGRAPNPMLYDGFVAKLSADGSTILWATYLGGSADDYINALALDVSGNAVLAGYTQSSDFPTTAGAYQRSPVGAQNGFVAKLSADGASLLASTFLDSVPPDPRLDALALDASGNAVVGGTEGYTAKLSADESTLLWETRLPGTADTTITALVLDAQGSAVVAGSTNATNFPTTPGAYQRTNAGNYDGFVAKRSADGSSLLWATYLGGSGYDDLEALALDADGNVVVGGSTASGTFPTTAGAYQSAFIGQGTGQTDAFVSKLSADGSALMWSTFLGGKGSDYIYALALDTQGEVLAGGITFSTDYPTTTGAFQRVYGNSGDGLLARFSGDGASLLWSTYLGGFGHEEERAIALDASGNVVAGGITGSTDFPVTAGAYQTGIRGVADLFVAKLSMPPGGVLAASATSLSTGSFTFTATPSGSGAIQSVSFVLDGSPLQTVTTAPYVVTVDSTGLSEGVHALRAYATAGGGLQGYLQPDPLSFTVDRTAPGGTVGSSLALGTFTFTASPTDALGPLQRVTFYLDGAFDKSVYAPPYTTTCHGAALPDGPHTLAAYAVDAAGNLGYLQPQPLTFTVEHTPPTGTFSITGSSGPITFAGTATDASGIQRITFYVDGVFVASDYSSPYSIAFDSTGLGNGSHVLLVYAMDNMGNLGYLTRGRAFTVNNATSDTTPPAVSKLSVAGTAGVVILGAYAKDDHLVMKADFYVDGGLVGTDTSYFSPSGYSVPWASIPGNHTLVVKATDGAGNVTTSASYPFTTN